MSWVVAMPLLAVGCSGDRNLGTFGSAGVTEGSMQGPGTGTDGLPEATDSHAAEEGGSGAGDDDGYDDDGALRLDVAGTGGLPGDGGSEGEGCEKVDFLFVIDNSSSMKEKQDKLRAAFPDFMQAIRDTLPTTDYHVMVADSDTKLLGCELVCEREVAAGRVSYGEACDITFGCCYGYPCGAAKDDTCHDIFGAGVIQNYGRGSSNGRCGFSQTKRFLEADDPGFDSKFECASQVGIAGSADESPMASMVGALTDPAAMACNGGFLRDDAILVVTIISDAVDEASRDLKNGDPALWRQAVIDAKNGDASAAVVMAFASIESSPCIGQWPPKMTEFVESFGAQGHLFDQCLPDYVAPFKATVQSIANTCSGFTPPG